MNDLSYKSLKLAKGQNIIALHVQLIVFMYFDTYFQPRTTFPRSVQKLFIPTYSRIGEN